MKINKRLITLLLAAVLLIGSAIPAAGATYNLQSEIEKTAAYLQKATPSPTYAVLGGEWTIIGLSRSGIDVPRAYYETYYENVCKHVAELNGVLDARSHTFYSRAILGITAAGYDPRDVAGYNLLVPLANFKQTIWQGINGPIWALIALDCGNYEIPAKVSGDIQATREMYVEEILRRQLPDGGWNLTAGANGTIAEGEVANSDLTGMALQALANYKSLPGVSDAIDRALVWLSENQSATGDYTTGGTATTLESTAQVLVAITALGISIEDSRFVKNGQTLVDGILRYRTTDGGFKHVLDGTRTDQMATEQAFYTLVAAKRSADGKTRLYEMSDITPVTPPKDTGDGTPTGLPNKHADVTVQPVISANRTFDDIAGHANQTAIEALAARGIINGVTADRFAPDQTMTRAQFATITTQALGLVSDSAAPFTDVAASDWFAKTVSTAYAYGIIKGTSETTFTPAGTITRQEAAVMVARAAKLCGLDTELSDAVIRETLAEFDDARSVADWATGSMAFCYSSGILDNTALEIEPTATIRRCEIAEMIHRMLKKAELL